MGREAARQQRSLSWKINSWSLYILECLTGSISLVGNTLLTGQAREQRILLLRKQVPNTAEAHFAI